MDRLQAYLHDVNRVWVDGRSERLYGYYGESEVWGKAQKRWQRVREKEQRRKTIPFASKLRATPLCYATIGEDLAEVVLSLSQQLYYKQENVPYVQECLRVERVRMRRDDDNLWLFLEPWGTFFPDRPSYDTEEYRQNGRGQAEQSESLPAPSDSRQDEPAAKEVVVRGGYNRAKAVAYAETYWNSYNPAYLRFEVDCTNFVSQCLHAGGIPMLYANSRSRGWWYRGGARPSWSFSWAVAHSLYLLLRSGKAPFYARQVASPDQLEIGDVICYDFDGDGRWQHNTIVVAKDAAGMPLVNAHTTDSRQRYWEYRDSTAYTPNIRYGFFHIRGAAE
ncbi:MAG: amidase domain-containing protein [Brevibacillus sp.]|nr:amidase domain-containing protein [Brevibacillus sp.]